MRLGQRRPLPVQHAGFLSTGGSLAESYRVPREAEDKIRQAPMGHDIEDCQGRDMTVPTHLNRGAGPVMPQRREETGQDHRVFRTGRPCPWAAVVNRRQKDIFCRTIYEIVILRCPLLFLTHQCRSRGDPR